MSAMIRATVVLPVPGLPVKTRWAPISISGRPRSLRFAFILWVCTMALTLCLTGLSPSRASSRPSAWLSDDSAASVADGAADAALASSITVSITSPSRRRARRVYRAIESSTARRSAVRVVSTTSR